MAIAITEFLQRIARPDADLYLLACTELLVYDNDTKIVYIPVTTHQNTHLNPMGDFRTHIGHWLLWSHHVEIDGSSGDLYNLFGAEGYAAIPLQTDADYQIYALKKQTAA